MITSTAPESEAAIIREALDRLERLLGVFEQLVLDRIAVEERAK